MTETGTVTKQSECLVGATSGRLPNGWLTGAARDASGASVLQSETVLETMCKDMGPPLASYARNWPVAALPPVVVPGASLGHSAECDARLFGTASPVPGVDGGSSRPARMDNTPTKRGEAKSRRSSLEARLDGSRLRKKHRMTKIGYESGRHCCQCVPDTPGLPRLVRSSRTLRTPSTGVYVTRRSYPANKDRRPR